jgi:UPF0271 protein
VAEGFADRAYQPDGTLVPRNQPGAVIEQVVTVVTRAITMARDHVVIATDGSRVPLQIETICVHGDTPGAAALARHVRDALKAAGIDITAMGAASA